jgi:hypothetical protein
MAPDGEESKLDMSGAINISHLRRGDRCTKTSNDPRNHTKRHEKLPIRACSCRFVDRLFRRRNKSATQ